MSRNVVAWRGSALSPRKRSCRGSDDHEHVTLPEQHAPARGAVTADLAGREPSINGSNIDAAQPSDFHFRQKPIVIGVFGCHDRLLSRHTPASTASSWSKYKAPTYLSAARRSLNPSVAAQRRGGSEDPWLCGPGFGRVCSFAFRNVPATLQWVVLPWPSIGNPSTKSSYRGGARSRIDSDVKPTRQSPGDLASSATGRSETRHA
jgi:hypothetical protein